ncbi:hypothetical protein B9479_001291 [Cryptococcus floricola]|uniref:Uncharacterized protein n=1 Tax=Cryptococcus floricola TaxID=2591691 RepID=A0A5D3B6L4_9TREE|nr:hypothetical protein B9479_001291 [Cryptococcus floricola]
MSATATVTYNGEQEDLELATIPTVVAREAGERDPYSLRNQIVEDDVIDNLRKRKAGGKKIANFYEGQNERINGMLKPLSAHTADAKQSAADNALKVKIAINVSFAMNICLAIIQLYAAVSSLSLAMFASCIDAVDPFANLILWFAHRRADKTDENKWPVRGSRFETM